MIPMDENMPLSVIALAKTVEISRKLSRRDLLLSECVAVTSKLARWQS
jgi:hypothetical protein